MLRLLVLVSVPIIEVALLVESAEKLFDAQIALNREPTLTSDTITPHRDRLVSTGTYLLLLGRSSVLL